MCIDELLKITQGAFEPFPISVACVSDMNPNVINCEDTGVCPEGWRDASLGSDDDSSDWEACNNKYWEYKPEEDSFIENSLIIFAKTKHDLHIKSFVAVPTGFSFATRSNFTLIIYNLIIKFVSYFEGEHNFL